MGEARPLVDGVALSRVRWPALSTARVRLIALRSHFALAFPSVVVEVVEGAVSEIAPARRVGRYGAIGGAAMGVGNVSMLSINCDGALLAQFISLVVGPGGQTRV